MNRNKKTIHIARIHGFCSGVSTAIAIVDNALEKYGPPLYVYHEIVHNTFVVKDFKERGVVFVEQLKNVPEGGRVIFSAHGVAPAIMNEANERRLVCIDATCPLVKKVHNEAKRFSQEGRHVILVGNPGHQEVIGTSGYVAQDRLHIISHIDDIKSLDLPPETPLAYVTQTTLSVDDTLAIKEALKKRFNDVMEPAKEDICYATQSRQDAVKELAKVCDIIIICGSANSSNSNRLQEIGQRLGVPTYIVDHAGELNMSLLDNSDSIGISSGASVPNRIVQELIAIISKRFPQTVVISGGQTDAYKTFPLPEV